MAGIPGELKDEIKARADIADVISHYITIQEKGNKFVALCPFHNDHDPSLNIFPDKQTFKCFVCNAGGDVFEFVKNKENISFIEAVQRVAEMIGFKLPSVKKKVSKNQILYDLLDLFNDYCNYELYTVQGRQARAYLKKRGFTEEIINKFQIGYVPDSKKSGLFFKGKRINPLNLVQSGLIRNKDDLNSSYFYNRVTIPIHDAYGNPIGVTARSLSSQEKSVPKYINTKTTDIYKKATILFNYHRAIKASKQSGKLVLVEGAMDVLGLEKAGIDYGVALLGTSFTDYHFDLLLKTNAHIVVLLDADSAGQKASFEFGKKALSKNLKFSIASVKAGKDVDECYEQQGRKGVIESINSDRAFIDFAFDYLYRKNELDRNPDSAVAKETFKDEILNVIMNIKPYERESALRKLSDLIGYNISEKELDNLIDKTGLSQDIPNLPAQNQLLPPDPFLPPFTNFKKVQKKELSTRNFAPLHKPADRILEATEIVLYNVLKRKQACEELRENLVTFQDERATTLYQLIKAFYKTNEAFDLERFENFLKADPDLTDTLSESEVHSLFNWIKDILSGKNRLQMDVPLSPDRIEFTEAYLTLIEESYQTSFKKKSSELKEFLRTANMSTSENQAKAKVLYSEKQSLQDAILQIQLKRQHLSE